MSFDIILLDFLGMPTCFWWWLLGSLGAFLLGCLVCNWLSGHKRRAEELEEERNRLSARNIDLEKEIASLKYDIEKGELDKKDLSAKLSNAETERLGLMAKIEELSSGTDLKLAADLPDADAGLEVGNVGMVAASLNYGNIFEEDNLQVIEGIGPKIEGLLKAAGFNTWALLGAAPLDAIQKVLDDAGPRYRIHNPKTWSEQARLAANGEWDELVKYQKFLDAGRDNKGDFENPSKIEKLGMKILGFSNNPEDLKVVEGIGPKIEQLLKAGGINTWAELAAAPVDRLKEILAEAGERYRLAVPDTWPKQAELAAAGKWSELSEYQDFLDGGKEPGK
ncbi:MAG: helix-hairpin-helix domain-containing protein [Bacteroidota bacterium]